MKQKIILNAARSFQHVQVAWQPAAIAILNNTPWSLLMREGAQERPDAERYDYLVPPGTNTILPVIAHEFSFALDNNYPNAPSYAQPCTILILDDKESAPDFGSSSYRTSVFEQFELLRGNTHDITLDTRAARALFMSAQIIPSEYGEAWLWPVNGYIAVYTAPNADKLVMPADSLITRLISIPRTTAALEAVVPLSANYTLLRFVNPPGAPAQGLACRASINLLDAIPSLPSRYVSEYHWSEFVFSGPEPGVLLLDTMLNGVLEALEIAVKPENPADNWMLTFYLHSGFAGTFSEPLRFRLSDAQNVTIMYGGPNALPTRPTESFLGRDTETGAMAWRFVINRYIDRQLRVYLDVPAGVSNLSVHFGTLIRIPI